MNSLPNKPKFCRFRAPLKIALAGLERHILVADRPAHRVSCRVDYNRKMKAVALFLALAVCVHADMYLHNPR